MHVNLIHSVNNEGGAAVKIFAWPSEIGQNEKGIRTGGQGLKKQVMRHRKIDQ